MMIRKVVYQVILIGMIVIQKEILKEHKYYQKNINSLTSPIIKREKDYFKKKEKPQQSGNKSDNISHSDEDSRKDSEEEILV